MIDTTLHNDSNLSIDSDSISDLANLILNNHGHVSGKINIIITDDDSLREIKNFFLIKMYLLMLLHLI